MVARDSLAHRRVIRIFATALPGGADLSDQAEADDPIRRKASKGVWGKGVAKLGAVAFSRIVHNLSR